MIKYAHVIATAFVLAFTSAASAQTLPAPPDKPATAPQQTAPAPKPPANQQQAAPANPAAAPAAQPAQKAPAMILLVREVPNCTKQSVPTVADPAYKQLTIRRPPSGVAAGMPTGILLPGQQGLDRVDAAKQHVVATFTCAGGNVGVSAIVSKVTKDYEEMVIMVPPTIGPFEMRSCSNTQKDACAYGTFAGDVSLPVMLGAFLGGTAQASHKQ